MLLLLLTIACGPTEEPEPIDARAVAARVDEALQQSARLDADGQTENAVLSWALGAHRFEHELEPWLRQNAGELQVARIEYQLALMRGELGMKRGKPASKLETYVLMVEDWLPEPAPSDDGAVLADPIQ